jgi:KipI family sensor histidine kinase inhibitor
VPAVVPYGDSALLVVVGDEVSPELSREVHELAGVLRERMSENPKWGAPVPGYAAVLVPYDSLLLSQSDATERLSSLLAAQVAQRHAPAPETAPSEPIDIAVRYGGDDGPDLVIVAETLGLTPAQVVELHGSKAYDVLLLGFAPGFAYLGMLPEELVMPRRATPRTRVAPGSVAIAGRQTAVYPSATPGGWHLIGRTELVMWDVTRDPPALLEPGRRVRFRPVRD